MSVVKRKINSFHKRFGDIYDTYFIYKSGIEYNPNDMNLEFIKDFNEYYNEKDESKFEEYMDQFFLPKIINTFNHRERVKYITNLLEYEAKHQIQI